MSEEKTRTRYCRGCHKTLIDHEQFLCKRCWLECRNKAALIGSALIGSIGVAALGLSKATNGPHDLLDAGNTDDKEEDI